MSQRRKHLWLASAQMLCALGLAVSIALGPASGDDKRERPPSDKEIARLILQLGDAKFAMREKAQRALLQIGTPAVQALLKAASEGDLETCMRARQLVEQIDPGWSRRAALEGQRAALRKEIEALPAKAVDVTKFAKKIPNPFTALTDEGKAKLKLRGVDPDPLPKLNAVFLTGRYCGAGSKDFVNNDPNTILVIGKGFITHGQVYSLGPILAVGDAHFMNNVSGADLVWFVDESFPRGQTRGAPVILAPTARHSQMGVVSEHVWQGDYGWRAPKD